MHGTSAARLLIAGFPGVIGLLAAVVLPNSASAIVNGIAVSQATYESTFPWAAAVYDPVSGAVCSAELISPTYVLTAAHCTGATTVQIGATDRTTVMPIAVSNAIVHPSYDPVNRYYDVALLHLATPVYNTPPVQLATQAQANSYLTPNRAAVIAGFGRTTSAGGYSNVLMQRGAVMYGLNLQFTWIVYFNSSTGPCAGDSGGPLIVQVSGVGPVLMGIADVTQGDLCVTGGGTAGYTNIAQMLPFINTTNVPDLGQILVPSAAPDTATTTQDLPVAVSVAANDGGFDSPVTVAIVTPPANGAAAVNGSPGAASSISVTYTPGAGFVGWDSLVYSVTDGVSSDTATLTLAVLPDADHDGVFDGQDNCSNDANASQLDADGDGYGNLCDADLNNSGFVTTADFAVMLSVLGQSPAASPTAAAADLNGSGWVTSTDFAILRNRLNAVPGPSGLHP